MSALSEGMYVFDPVTNSPVFMSYSEMEEDSKEVILKPIGGFCYQADQFVQLRLPPVPYYVRDWLPKHGKAVIYAPPKSGKSFLAIQIARCIGSGLPFVDIPTTQGRVLAAQFELGQEVLQGRLKLTGKSYPEVFLGTTFSMKIDTEGGQRLLHKAMEAIHPDVLILDPLVKMMAGDENETRDMSKLVDILDEFIEAYGCSILVIHHPGKDITRGGRGSSVLEGWVDSYIEMKRTSKQEEPLKTKINPKLLRHAQLPPEPITLALRNFEFVREDGSPTVKDEVEAFIKSRWVTAGDTVSPAQILAVDIGSSTSVYEALGKLVEEGKIVQVKRGEYQWKK